MSFLIDFISNTEFILRILVSILLGGIIGFERILAHKHAGVRTFSLVSLGSCLFIILGQLTLAQSDTSLARVLANIILGIGFLGGGVIFTQKERVKGLTTAAALWVCAGIGATVGLGYYGLAIWVTLLILALLYLIGEWEKSLKKNIEDNE